MMPMGALDSSGRRGAGARGGLPLCVQVSKCLRWQTGLSIDIALSTTVCSTVHTSSPLVLCCAVLCCAVLCGAVRCWAARYGTYRRHARRPLHGAGCEQVR